MTKKEFRMEMNKVHKEILFYARRLTYNSVKYYPEWQEKYKEACKRRDELYKMEFGMAYKEYLKSGK